MTAVPSQWFASHHWGADPLSVVAASLPEFGTCWTRSFAQRQGAHGKTEKKTSIGSIKSPRRMSMLLLGPKPEAPRLGVRPIPSSGEEGILTPGQNGL
ncbi:hypothetical protein Y1Q_0000452 [Alligator mississippiensis]|uniref:Uncharacterized protein n=1 Tax=Alligator mississippiensis TaxID=8496 RepID=A0A151MB29_ALLMI|nr:hypothetical protein Y1Q_0000452 [Alligator mississippiensis]